MPTTFETIVDSIHEQLGEDWPSNSVGKSIGRKASHHHRAPNHVSWINPGGTTAPVDGVGPGIHTVDSEDVASHAIATDELQVEAEVWGETDELTEKIRRAVIRAAYRRLTFRSLGEVAWRNVTEEVDVASETNLGAKHRLSFVFRVPLTDVEEQPTALITSESHTCEFVDEIT